MAGARIPIQKRTRADGGVSYRVQIRQAGAFPLSKTFRKLADAKDWYAKKSAAMREEKDFPEREARRHSVADMVDRRLATIERDKPHALPKQRQLLTWWKDKLGPFKLSAITPAIVSRQRDELLAENIGTAESPKWRSPSTVNRYLAALAKAMSDAVREWHWLRENPVRQVAKGPESQGRVRFLSDAERVRLLEACRASGLRELELIVLLALTTGMRKGEILGLRWQDIDIDRRQAVLHWTKNRERRAVLIVPRVADMLAERQRVRRQDTDLVFPLPGFDKPVEVAHWFERALAAAKIEDFRFHDLRHTAASYLAMSGATTQEIAAVLGHKTLAMVKRYSHLSDAHTGAVVGRMTEKFFSDPKT